MLNPQSGLLTFPFCSHSAAAVGYKLTVQPKLGFDDRNSSEYLDGLRSTILQRLSQLQGPPSVGFHERAPDGMELDDMQVPGGGGGGG
jgi:hypothetical protein